MKTKNKTMNARLSTMLGVALTMGLGSMDQVQAQLYFSEYAEGTGSNKCVEIYHCGSEELDLTNWQYHSYMNGNTTAQYVIDLVNIQSTLAAGEILVICNPAAAANSTLTLANVDLFSNSIQFNGNDAVAIYNTASGTYSDIFGDASSSSNFAVNNTWRRTCDVVTANAFPGANNTSNWTTAGIDNLSGFGTFAGCESCPQAGEGEACEYNRGDESCPMITGYLEGTSWNKCIEITNPTCDTICLSNIEYRAYHNGAATPTYRRTLGDFKDFLLPGESYVICNPQADSLTLLVADTTWTGIQHNGNDALALWNFTQDDYCDIFGNIGEDSLWIEDCGSGDTNRTFNTNLTRNSTVCGGVVTDPANGFGFPTLCSEWTQDLDTNTTVNLGSHDVSFCHLIFGCGSPKKGADNATGFSTGEMNVYPNPASDAATFEFSVVEGQSATLRVFTLTGVMVAQPFYGQVEEGVTYRVNFDVSNLPSGTYIYRFDAGASSTVGNITVLK